MKLSVINSFRFASSICLAFALLCFGPKEDFHTNEAKFYFWHVCVCVLLSVCCIYPQITTRNSAPSVRKIDVKLCAENVSQFIFSPWRALQPDSDSDPESDPDATRFDLIMLADAGRQMAAMVTLE